MRQSGAARCGRAYMVAVKLSSTPDIASGETTTTTAYKAIDTIIRTLSGHGCSE